MVHARVLEDFPGVALVAGIDTCARDLTFQRGQSAGIFLALRDDRGH